MKKMLIYVRPQVRQRLLAILMELVLLYIPLIDGNSSNETITTSVIIGIMGYTLLVSIIPIYIFLTKEYLLFDTYPLKLALRLQDQGKLSRKARKDLARCGVVFAEDEDGWYVVDYDAPTAFAKH